MSYDKDPPPLADASSEAPESLRALLRSAKSDLPTSAQLAALEAKLGPMLSGGGSPSAAPGMGTLGKVGLAALGGLLVAGGLYLTTRPPTPASKAPAAPAPAPERSEPAKPATEPAPTAPSTGDELEKPATSAAPGAVHLGAPAAKPSTVPEDQLLERARRALTSDPNRALALTKEHARLYPKGVLSQEREVIAIEALKRIGRTGEADSRRGAFEQQYPQSAHRRNLDGAAKADGGK